MKKYHLLLTVVIFLIVQVARAQITLNLALNNRPQPWLSDWVNPVNGQMIISYMQGPAINDPSIKLKTTLLDERGSIIGVSNINSARIYTLRAGVNQFTIADALQLQNLALQGNLQNLLQRTGRLTAGQYQLMVEVMNTRGDVVRAKQTRPFFITSYQLPILMQPASGSSLDAHTSQNIIIFRWTNLIPGTRELPQYRVQVFEILPGQTPMQAFRGNRPLLDESAIKGTTQYIWLPNLPMLDSTANKQFIWTVQTLDAKGLPIPGMDMNIQGRSEPAIFSIVNQMGIIDKKRKNDDSIK
ncbi:MAG: hypothetical protein KKE39_02335 [Bacteroidetes bacterium]|nr:hypothetical protein [Bacteroidota bacterium]MBU1371799.1 hypothetical protein [Bacteroidota bacterium]MBU1483316.1 hypothetical protein [Bacteroidota bacterium]MBU1761390.1 hypothetical protein [Bacteroidota bacterium]MBU2268809.1 hypothetical protein [Bacteroidota bacterium]